MPRFALLTHDHPFPHWDFLIETGPACRTWRLQFSPDGPGPIAAEPLADHRLLYLDYEGPVSGGRGQVAQWDAGEYSGSASGTDLNLTLRGRRLNGTVRLQERSGDWTWEFKPPLTEAVLSDGLYERTVWEANCPGEVSSALVFLDAELYLERVGAPAVVRRLQDQGLIPPTALLYVSHGGPAARHTDFVCSPKYAQFVCGTVVDRIRRMHPAVRDFVIAGLSLSGLAAAYLASRHPEIFRVALCQSGSFWWDHGRFARELPPASRAKQKYWMCVGNQETSTGVSHPPTGLRQEISQLQGCDLAFEAFQTQGYRVRHRVYDGGHDPVCWREDLAEALIWAWQTESDEPIQSGP